MEIVKKPGLWFHASPPAWIASRKFGSWKLFLPSQNVAQGGRRAGSSGRFEIEAAATSAPVSTTTGGLRCSREGYLHPFGPAQDRRRRRVPAPAVKPAPGAGVTDPTERRRTVRCRGG